MRIIFTTIVMSGFLLGSFAAFAADVESFSDPKIGDLYFLRTSNRDGVCVALGFTEHVRGTVKFETPVTRMSTWQALGVNDFGALVSQGTVRAPVVVDEAAEHSAMKVNAFGKQVGVRFGKIIREIDCVR